MVVVTAAISVGQNSVFNEFVDPVGNKYLYVEEKAFKKQTIHHKQRPESRVGWVVDK